MCKQYAGKFGAEKTYLFYFEANRLYPKRINFFCRKWVIPAKKYMFIDETSIIMSIYVYNSIVMNL